ncbi:hemerythrin domain-containing protein [Mycolicibacterium septicum]|uniref:hemerythrin domain-containing protein n=1 Tax=Mycolicibacterium septicum TaxID=98668 RepID=UPI002360839E|nr:hemerythrin domain-containing protein [Mycolicibacterium septicum]
MTSTDPTPASDSDKHRRNAQTELVDVRDMLVIHAALAREFGLAPAAVRRVRSGDRKHARKLDDHLAFVCNLLHEHHVGEDEIVWPTLRARLSPADCRLLDKVETQHAGINAGLERVQDARQRFLEQPDPSHGATLATELEILHELVVEHLADEERDILPLAAAYLSDPEWRAIGQSLSALSPKSLLLGAGMCIYQADPEVIALMFKPIPAPVRVIVPLISSRLYARQSLRIHGTREP